MNRRLIFNLFTISVLGFSKIQGYSLDPLFLEKTFAANVLASFKQHPTEKILEALGDDQKKEAQALLFALKKEGLSPSITPDLSPQVILGQLREDSQKLLKVWNQRLDERQKAFETCHFQHPLQGRFLSHIRLISELLVADEGKIHIALIPLLKQIKAPYSPSLINSYQRVLDSLQNDPKLQNLLAAITPPDPVSPQEKLIKLALGKAKNSLYEKGEATQVILAALMANLRQDIYVGSCFATSIGIAVGRNHLEEEVQDYMEIAHKGYLTRFLKQGEEKTPFLFKMNAEPLKRHKITLEIRGEKAGSFSIKNQQLYLEADPGFQAVFSYLGVSEPKKFMKEALSALRSQREFSLYDIIRAIVRQYAQDNPSQKPHQVAMIDELVYVFRAQSYQALQSAWDNILSSMAEARDSSMFKKRGIKHTLSSLSVRLGKDIRSLNSSPSALKDLKNQLTFALREKLKERIKMKYDPTLAWSSKSLDGSSANGAFVLYLKKLGVSPFDWQRVDHENLYASFIHELIQQEADLIEQDIENQALKKDFNRLIKDLSGYVKSPEFIKDLEKRLNRSSGSGRYKRYPWMIRAGHHPSSVLKAYTGKKISYLSTYPKSSHELYDEVALLSMKYGKALKSIYLENSQFSIPMTSPHHAFVTMMGQEKIALSWKDRGAFKELKNEYLLFPGMQLGSTPMGAKSKEAVIQYLKRKFPGKGGRSLEKEAKSFPDSISYRDFYRRSREVLSSFSYNPSFMKNVSMYFDNAFFKYLSPEKKEKLPSLVFADSNWSIGAKDAYFAFTVSLATGDLIVVSISDDRQEVKVQPQQTTFFTKPGWEFFKASGVF